jgi:putative ABC transport system permease protein
MKIDGEEIELAQERSQAPSEITGDSRNENSAQRRFGGWVRQSETPATAWSIYHSRFRVSQWLALRASKSDIGRMTEQQERLMESPAYTGITVWQLVWNDLKSRPVRTTVAIIGVAIEIVLVLLIVGMTSGVISEWAHRVEGVGADILIQPPNSSIFLALTSPVMQESLRDKIAALKSIDEVSPVLVAADTRGLDLIYGIDYTSFNALSANGFRFLRGEAFSGPDEAIVDDLKAASKKLKVGDKIVLLGHEFSICGIVYHGRGARYYIPLKTAQELVGAEGRISMFYVRSTDDIEATRQQLAQILPGHKILSMAEYLSLMNSTKMPELRPFIRSMVIVGVTISFLVVLLTMHSMVSERTREIGILKALGASRLAILRLMLQESLLLAALGAAAGLACTFGIKAVLEGTVPTLTILISQGWVLRAVALALAGALAGAIYPAYRAATIDPVDALAYE